VPALAELSLGRPRGAGTRKTDMTFTAARSVTAAQRWVITISLPPTRVQLSQADPSDSELAFAPTS
jgi:hypothetical protein